MANATFGHEVNHLLLGDGLAHPPRLHALTCVAQPVPVQALAAVAIVVVLRRHEEFHPAATDLAIRLQPVVRLGELALALDQGLQALQAGAGRGLAKYPRGPQHLQVGEGVRQEAEGILAPNVRSHLELQEAFGRSRRRLQGLDNGLKVSAVEEAAAAAEGLQGRLGHPQEFHQGLRGHETILERELSQPALATVHERAREEFEEVVLQRLVPPPKLALGAEDGVPGAVELVHPQHAQAMQQGLAYGFADAAMQLHEACLLLLPAAEQLQLLSGLGNSLQLR
mmetsp:Transcript_96962/g.224764  ORF Transcript_96962/g.224764 Transcript_96962/m.224764 type:complete len:282 (-) Transcript_96962:288-1133(-)